MFRFMGRGVIDVPLKKVAEFLKKVENNLTWDDLLIVSHVLYSYSQIDKMGPLNNAGTC